MAVINLFLESRNFFTLEAGQVIFERGDHSDFMYGIVDGKVEIRVGDRLLETIGDGAVFGEMSLIDHEPRSATAVAKTECRVVQVDAAGFYKLIAENPAFALDVMRTMSTRLRRQLEHKGEVIVKPDPEVI